MTFTTTSFWVFFAAFFPLFLATRGQTRKWVLLGFSYLFYGSWDVRFLGLLIASTCFDYYVGRKIGAAADAKVKRRWLIASLVSNLGILSYFKYANFFIESAVSLLRQLGTRVDAPDLNVVLPVGISFYTFQALSYVIDVYRGKCTPARSFLDFAAYTAFFPQLVAGPIERATHFLPQLEQHRRAAPLDFTAIALIGFGAFKKIIADHYVQVVDPVFNALSEAHPLAVWVATYCFAIQIYLDFSGYSDIAVGLARLLGFDIVQNFEAPYAADSPSDFWRRWHISLSTWLRDYLYIPLGGSRGGNARTMLNLFITMVLGGLWHGAAWNYVLWGVYHGGLLALGRLSMFERLGRLLPRRAESRAEHSNVAPSRGRWSAILRRIATFHLICLGWALFRAESLSDCVIALEKLLNPFGFDAVDWFRALRKSKDLGRVVTLLAGGTLIVALHHLFPITPRQWIERLRAKPMVLRYALVACFFYGAALLAPEEAPAFIYFQF